MKKIFGQTVEQYFYDSKEERENHVKLMVSQGWKASEKEKQFTGMLMVDDVEDENNYAWFAEFYQYSIVEKRCYKKQQTIQRYM